LLPHFDQDTSADEHIVFVVVIAVRLRFEYTHLIVSPLVKVSSFATGLKSSTRDITILTYSGDTPICSRTSSGAS